MYKDTFPNPSIYHVIFGRPLWTKKVDAKWSNSLLARFIARIGT